MSNSRFKSNFFKNIFTLIKGSMIAQGLSLAISPIIARLYTPEEFGIFALYVSIVSILTVVSTGRYELAIVLPKEEKEAFSLFKLAIVISAVFSVFLFVLSLFSAHFFAEILQQPRLVKWLYFIPFSVFLLSCYNALNMFLTRHKIFKTLANSKISQTSSTAMVNLGGGYLNTGEAGLILGQFIGQFSAVIFMWSKSKKHFSVTYPSLKKTAIKYKDFPLKNSFSGAFNLMSSQVPVLLIGSFFGTSVLGFYALVLRVLNMPLNLIGKSFSQVYFQKIGTIIREHPQKEFSFVAKMTLQLFAISVVPAIILYFFGNTLFGFVFGENWREAGDIASIFSIFYLVRFVYFSQSTYLIAKNKLNTELILNATLFLSQLTAILVGNYIYHDFKITFVLMSILGTISYSLFLLTVFKLARK